MSRLDSLVFLWRRRAFIEEAVKPLIFDRPKAGSNVALCGSRGTS